MNPAQFLKGAAIGFSIAAPVGPIGILCIRRSLRSGSLAGFVSGLGAATADAAYGCVAAFGITAVSRFLTQWQHWISAAGGVYLCYLGIRTFQSRAGAEAPAGEDVALPSAFASTFVLTLSNPSTILSFAALFAGFGTGLASDYRSAGLWVGGVFAGSAAWWLILALLVASLRTRVSGAGMQAVNRVAGCVLAAFGVCVLLRAIP
jgi:threonine/homoserine/homoserine lactone efflux protein